MAVSASSTARLAVVLVTAILAANLLSLVVATLTFREAVVNQGQRTVALARRVIQEERLRSLVEQEVRLIRFHLHRPDDPQQLPAAYRAREEAQALLGELAAEAEADGPGVEEIERRHLDLVRSLDRLVQTARGPPEHAEIALKVEEEVLPRQDALLAAIDLHTDAHQQRLLDAGERAERDLAYATQVVGAAELISSLLGLGLAVILWRALRQLAVNERVVQAQVQKLETINRDLDLFAGRVAHDLRNALAPMRLSVGRLRQKATAAPELEKLTGTLERSGDRVSSIVEALLQFSRAKGAAPTGASEVVEVVEGVLEEAAPLAESLGVQLERQVAPGRVACDAGTLHVLVANLVNNAVKFLEACPTRQVRVTGTAEGKFYLLRVSDTGPGIPEASRVRIFEPFFREQGRQIAGFGIGLATVRRIADAMGGSVEVDPHPKEGSTFTLRLPLARG